MLLGLTPRAFFRLFILGDVELSDMLVKNSARLDRARTVLEDLHSTGMVSSSPSFPPHAETKKISRDGRQ